MARNAAKRTALKTYATQYEHEGRHWLESVKAVALYDAKLHTRNEARQRGLRVISTLSLNPEGCATRLPEAMDDIKLVQEWLGHGSIVVTARTHGQVLTHRLVSAAEALSKLRGTHSTVVEHSVTESVSNRKSASSYEVLID